MSLCKTVRVHDGLTLADQLLALCVAPKPRNPTLRPHVRVRLGSVVVRLCCGLESLSQYTVAVSTQDGVVHNMHEFFHNLSCPLAVRRGHAYLLHVLSSAHKTPGTQFVTSMALTRRVGVLKGCSINHVV